MFKKIVVHTRRSIKLIVLLMIAALIMVGIVFLLYRQTYSVSINGQQVGYTKNKSELQARINDYIQNGDEDNVAFVQIDNLPEYNICLLKKDVTMNDDEIFENIKKDAIPYYRYYAIVEGGTEKLYVSNFEEAESIVNSLKEKNSRNMDALTIAEKYETTKQEFKTADEAIGELYLEPVQVAAVSTSNKTIASGTVNTASTTSRGKVNLGITLIQPVSGVISSRFGAISSIRSSAHTGLDISASSGTPIKAAASGTVTFSGYKGSYGNMLVITHTNSVQTYYAHCSKLYVSAGQAVSQGEVIAAVGSTGNSTGPHLHLEVRINGVAYNPQNYLY